MKRSRTCECGETKELAAPTCSRCEALDGKRPADQSFIAALRQLGGRGTSVAIERIMQVKRRHLLRLVERLLHDQRIVRVVTGAEGVIGTEPEFVLVERHLAEGSTPPVLQPDPGQLAFGLPGLSRVCGHKAARPVRTYGGRTIGWHCAVCTRVVKGSESPGRGRKKKTKPTGGAGESTLPFVKPIPAARGAVHEVSHVA